MARILTLGIAGGKYKLPGYGCLNCKDINQFTKEQKCANCGAIMPSDVAFQEYHMSKVHGLEELCQK